MKYWINVITKDHVLTGMSGGFMQANHGAETTLQTLREGDIVFFYSPGTLFRAGEILQAFTAIARVEDGEAHQVTLSARMKPWRRMVTSLRCEEAAIKPLIPDLDFISDKAHWGLSLRGGLFEIGKDDAQRIATAMKADAHQLD
jgi:EVE domain